MALIELFYLLLLAAIWGGSFILLRLLSVDLGATLTTELRVLIAGIFLIGILYFKKQKLEAVNHWKVYLLIGVFNSALPFFLYSWAAYTLPASYLVVINCSSPIFGIIFSTILLKEKLSWSKIIGVLVASLGVAILVKLGDSGHGENYLIALCASLAAAACYGFSGVLVKLRGARLSSLQIATGSQLGAALSLLPILFFGFSKPNFTGLTIGYLMVLSVFCTGFAYLIYFRLIKNIGPTKALTVTLFMPLFGIIWGRIFLNETLSLEVIFGAGLIMLGTRQVLRIPYSELVKKP